MKNILFTLFALLLTVGAMAQRDFMEDKVKVLYRWHTEFPEGSDSTQYAYYDVDGDGSMECLVKDTSGHKGMFWYSGNIIKFQYLGKADTSVTFWSHFIVSETYIVPELMVSGVSGISNVSEVSGVSGDNLTVEEAIVVMKGSRIVPQEKLTPAKIHKIITRLKKKPAVTWDDLDWQPLVLG